MEMESNKFLEIEDKRKTYIIVLFNLTLNGIKIKSLQLCY